MFYFSDFSIPHAGVKVNHYQYNEQVVTTSPLQQRIGFIHGELIDYFKIAYNHVFKFMKETDDYNPSNTLNSIPTNKIIEIEMAIIPFLITNDYKGLHYFCIHKYTNLLIKDNYSNEQKLWFDLVMMSQIKLIISHFISVKSTKNNLPNTDCIFNKDTSLGSKAFNTNNRIRPGTINTVNLSSFDKILQKELSTLMPTLAFQNFFFNQSGYNALTTTQKVEIILYLTPYLLNYEYKNLAKICIAKFNVLVNTNTSNLTKEQIAKKLNMAIVDQTITNETILYYYLAHWALTKEAKLPQATA